MGVPTDALRFNQVNDISSVLQWLVWAGIDQSLTLPQHSNKATDKYRVVTFFDFIFP